MAKKIYALRYDDGNNYYGDVEVLTDDRQKVYDYILDRSGPELDGTGFGLDEFGVDEDWRPNPVDAEEYGPVTEIVLGKYEPPQERRRGFRNYKFKYTGPRDIEHLSEIIDWLGEFTSDRYWLHSAEIDA